MNLVMSALAVVLLACRPAPAPPAAQAVAPPPASDAAGARERMVRDQIEARGVRDPRTLAAMRKVPRHELVPADVRAAAHEDNPLPIGHGQTISQPYIVAFMTEALGLRGGEKVLEVGTGSGYQAAVLAEIAAQVYTIEIVAPLAERARADLARLGYAQRARARGRRVPGMARGGALRRHHRHRRRAEDPRAAQGAAERRRAAGDPGGGGVPKPGRAHPDGITVRRADRAARPLRPHDRQGPRVRQS